MKICSKCGSINGDGSNNCNKCGTPLGSSQHRTASQNINQRRQTAPTQSHGQRPASQKPQTNQQHRYNPTHRSNPSQQPTKPASGTSNQNSFNLPKFLGYGLGGIILFGIILMGIIDHIDDSNQRYDTTIYNHYDNTNNTNNTNRNNRNNRTNNRSEAMVICPICNGSGRYSSEDIFRSQMPCTGCSGKGQIPSSQAMNIMKMHTPPSRPQQELCKVCHGTGSCHVCNYSGGVDYGGIKYCSTCGNTGRCRWCHGRGLVTY